MIKHNHTIRRLLPTYCLGVFDHFVGFALKGLRQLLEATRNDKTRPTSELFFYLGSRGRSEPLAGSKPNFMKHLTIQTFFWEYRFLKLVNGCFSDTKNRHPIQRLRVQNIKYLMHLEKNIYVSERDFI